MKTKLTITTLAADATLAEKGLSEAKVGDVKQILAYISDRCASDPAVVALLINNGLKRKKKKK